MGLRGGKLFHRLKGQVLSKSLHGAVLISINFSSFPTVGNLVSDLPEGWGAWV